MVITAWALVYLSQVFTGTGLFAKTLVAQDMVKESPANSTSPDDMQRRKGVPNHILIARPFHLTSSTPAELKTYVEEYLDHMIAFVNRARHSILILDYTAHGNTLNSHHELLKGSGHSLHSLYEAYYKALYDKVVKNPHLTYRRVIQLPYMADAEDINRGEQYLIKSAITTEFQSTILHILSLAKQPNFELYIVPHPMRTFGMIVIDDRYMLCEHDRYTKKGTSFPDWLTIDVGGNMNHAVQEVINGQIELINHILTPERKVDIEQFANTFFGITESFSEMSRKAKRTMGA